VKTTPNSPRRSVQVVESVRIADAVRQRIVRHMGIALDADEEAKLREVARRVEGPHEVLGPLFDYLRFDRVLDGRGAALLRDLVIARVMAPGSKRSSTEQLDLHYGRTH